MVPYGTFATPLRLLVSYLCPQSLSYLFPSFPFWFNFRLDFLILFLILSWYGKPRLGASKWVASSLASTIRGLNPISYLQGWLLPCPLPLMGWSQPNPSILQSYLSMVWPQPCPSFLLLWMATTTSLFENLRWELSQHRVEWHKAWCPPGSKAPPKITNYFVSCLLNSDIFFHAFFIPFTCIWKN